MAALAAISPPSILIPVFQAMPLLTELVSVRGGFTIHMALLTELSPSPHPYSTENSEEPILERSLPPQLNPPYPYQMIGLKWNNCAPWGGRSR
jgi:hypothetical protein